MLVFQFSSSKSAKAETSERSDFTRFTYPNNLLPAKTSIISLDQESVQKQSGQFAHESLHQDRDKNLHLLYLEVI